MPTAPSKVCSHAGCGVRVPSGERRCMQHEREITRQRLDKIKHNPFYSTQRWQKLRNWFIARNPLCAECGAVGECVDHIIQIAAGGEVLAESNLQTLCDYCHNKKRQREALASAQRNKQQQETAGA